MLRQLPFYPLEGGIERIGEEVDLLLIRTHWYAQFRSDNKREDESRRALTEVGVVPVQDEVDEGSLARIFRVPVIVDVASGHQVLEDGMAAPHSAKKKPIGTNEQKGELGGGKQRSCFPEALKGEPFIEFEPVVIDGRDLPQWVDS